MQFHSQPHLMFPVDGGEALRPNLLMFRVQPDEGLSLSFGIKCPGSGVRITLDDSPGAVSLCLKGNRTHRRRPLRSSNCR